jgi:hypothetical protein
LIKLLIDGRRPPISNLLTASTLSGRWDSNPRPSPWQGDVLPLNYTRKPVNLQTESAESQNRTGDTAIFSRVLYQLSYLGLILFIKGQLNFDSKAEVILLAPSLIVKQMRKQAAILNMKKGRSEA